MTKLKITKCIENLPSNHLLKQIEGRDQFILFLLYRHRGKQVSEVLKSLFLETDNPLKPLLKAKLIARKDYNCIWHEAKMYERLWDLVKLSAHHLQAGFEEYAGGYPFKSDFHLFAAIAFEMVNTDFSMWLEKYCEFPRDKVVKCYRLKVKQCREQLSLEEQKFLDESASQKGYPWLDLLLLVSHAHVTKRRTPLKTALEDFEKAMADFLEVQATYCRSKKSLVVKDGRIGVGRKNGGTYDFS